MPHWRGVARWQLALWIGLPLAGLAAAAAVAWKSMASPKTDRKSTRLNSSHKH